MEARHAADDGRIVPESPVTMNLTEIRKDAFDVVERLRPLWMPRQFCPLPCSQWSVHLTADGLNAILQSRDLASGRVVRPIRLQIRDLALDLLKFLLRFFGNSH